MGTSRAVIETEVDRPSPKRLSAKKSDFIVISAAELLARQLPQRELILAPWLPEKGLAMVYGVRGIGKTHLVMGCAWAIASGGSFLKWQAPRPRRVLVIDGEMPQQVLQERISAIKSSSQLQIPDFLKLLPLDIQERGLDLSNEDHQTELESAVEDAEVLIIDNVSTLSTGGKENEGESWLPVQKWALQQRRKGRSIIFVHHAGKSGQQRGTSRREDVLDTVIALRKPPNHEADQGARFEVHFEKNRGFFGIDAQPFDAALGTAGWTVRGISNQDMATVVQMTEAGLSVRQIEAETNIPKSRVNRIQVEARAVGNLTTNQEPRGHFDD